MVICWRASFTIGFITVAFAISSVAFAEEINDQASTISEDVSEIPHLVTMLQEELVWTYFGSIKSIPVTPGTIAYKSLIKIVEKTSVQHLEKWLQHDNWIVRANLTSVLKQNQSPAAITLLISMTNDKNATVRSWRFLGLRSQQSERR